MSVFIKNNSFILLLVAIFSAAIFMRPPLPVDETRYLTVAWEMWFKQDWINLTVNFEPYHHKPPMLFWCINLFWSIFGVSRWAATLPSIISAVLVVVLTEKLAAKLFPGEKDLPTKTRLLVLGSLPFLLYGSLIMFDMMLTVFELLALFCLLAYGEKRSFLSILGLGLCIGLGVLTKGPVIYIYTVLPALLGPLWIPRAGNRNWVTWYAGILIAVLISFVPVLMWLAPTLKHADENFLEWLLWKQTAGRITGGFSNAHNRSLFFYIPILPLFFLPWVFLPGFWRSLQARRKEARAWPALHFLACWTGPAFIAFSLISGKQPHYLVPLFPAFILAIAFFMEKVSLETLKKIVLVEFAVFVLAHAVAVKMFFPAYDWSPIAEFAGAHQEQPWAYVGNYNGEIGFLARLRQPLIITSHKKLPAWLAEHPDGYALMRYKNPQEVKDYDLLFAIPYRANHYAGIFRARH